MREMTRGRMTASIILTIALGILLSSMAAEKHASPAIGWAVAIGMFATANILHYLQRRPFVPCSMWSAAGKFVKSYIIAVICFMAACSLLVQSDRFHGNTLDALILMLFGAMQVVACAIYRLVYKGPDSWRRKREPKTVSAVSTRSAWPQLPVPQRGGNVIESLCRTIGWVVTRREADIYQVRSGDHRANVYIEIRYNERSPNVVFQSFFPIRFSLDEPPAGLFGRVLLRTASLTWASWALNIGESCDAQLCVNAGLPTTALDARLFGKVCEEIAAEIRGMRQELHDKFAYDLGGVMPEAIPREMRVELPVRRGDNLPGGNGGMKYLE